MTTTELQLYETFRTALEKKHAENAVQQIKNTVKNELQHHIGNLVTRQDLYDTKLQLQKEMSDLKTDLMKFMLAQTLVIVGVVIALIQLL